MKQGVWQRATSTAPELRRLFRKVSLSIPWGQGSEAVLLPWPEQGSRGQQVQERCWGLELESI